METFEPIKNHLADNASWDGCMFETFGMELKFILETHHKLPDLVWTIVEGDCGDLYVLPGFHLVNRLGFLVVQNTGFRTLGAVGASGNLRPIMGGETA